MGATNVAWFLEGEDEGSARVIKVEKSTPSVCLSDLKRFYDGPEAIFLIKTPDTHAFHWSVISDDNAPLPPCSSELVLVKVRPFNKYPTTLSYYIEGTFDPLPFTTFLEKPPDQVTLRDVQATYKGQPGVFFFKELDSNSSPQWIVVDNRDAVVPSIGSSILAKVRLLPPSELGSSVLAFHVDGAHHPVTYRILKPASQVTMVDVRAAYNGPAGDFFVLSGNQYIPAPASDDVILPSEKTLFRIRIRPHHTQQVSNPSSTPIPSVSASASAAASSLQSFTAPSATGQVYDSLILPDNNIPPQYNEAYLSALQAAYQQQQSQLKQWPTPKPAGGQ